jgi:hypothetical protein
MTANALNPRALRSRDGPSSAFEPYGDLASDPLTRNLKRAYDEVAAEPIPAEWLTLLGRLDGRTEDGDDA